ncbi:MAG: hypothetical protein RBT47_02695 [Anaerolineae bacterium]|jgi:hypothetical protein|nr:hypothetical protein [Anaerolineae bacterium]
MMSMMMLILVLLGVVGGLALLGLGGYALYESFTKEEGARVWLGSPMTLRIVGVIVLLAGLVLLVSPILLLVFGLGLMPVMP